jgi:hypothetical protein
MFEINYTNREKMFEETQSNFKKIEGIEVYDVRKYGIVRIIFIRKG